MSKRKSNQFKKTTATLVDDLAYYERLEKEVEAIPVTDHDYDQSTKARLLEAARALKSGVQWFRTHLASPCVVSDFDMYLDMMALLEIERGYTGRVEGALGKARQFTGKARQRVYLEAAVGAMAMTDWTLTHLTCMAATATGTAKD